MQGTCQDSGVYGKIPLVEMCDEIHSFGSVFGKLCANAFTPGPGIVPPRQHFQGEEPRRRVDLVAH